MNLSISSNLEADYLLITVVGTATDTEDAKLIAKRVYDEIMKHGSRRAIIDYTEYNPPDSLICQAELVEFFSEAFSDEIREWKLAIVVNSSNKRIADFWEIYANNRGYPYKVFYSMEKAQTYMSR